MPKRNLPLFVFRGLNACGEERNSMRVCRLILSLVTGLQVSAWCLYFYLFHLANSNLSNEPTILFVVVTSVTTFVVACILWRVTRPGPRILRWKPFAFVSLAFLQTGPLNHAVCEILQSTQTLPVYLLAPGELVINQANCLLTDQGTRIEIYDRVATAQQYKQFVDSSRKSIQSLVYRSTLLRKPFLEANCHGWAFAEGKHCVRSQDVQQILDENGYYEICVPQPDDLIIYRSADGVIVHTGIVRAVQNDDPIIESKWGPEGVYLHRVEVQPYSTLFAFWRTDRGTHTSVVPEDD